MLSDFKTWRNPERILSVAELAVFGRENYAADRSYERKYFSERFHKGFTELSYCGKDDSSTEIRVYSALGLDVSDKTDESVARYIREKGLYAGGEYESYIRKVLPEKGSFIRRTWRLPRLKGAKPRACRKKKLIPPRFFTIARNIKAPRSIKISDCRRTFRLRDSRFSRRVYCGKRS